MIIATLAFGLGAVVGGAAGFAGGVAFGSAYEHPWRRLQSIASEVALTAQRLAADGPVAPSEADDTEAEMPGVDAAA